MGKARRVNAAVQARRDTLHAALGLEEGCGAPNLDGYPQGDLMKAWHSFQRLDTWYWGRYMFPSRPAGYIAATRDLGAYAANKATAMACRERGDIRAALIYETACEHIYGSLPSFARW